MFSQKRFLDSEDTDITVPSSSPVAAKKARTDASQSKASGSSSVTPTAEMSKETARTLLDVTNNNLVRITSAIAAINRKSCKTSLEKYRLSQLQVEHSKEIATQLKCRNILFDSTLTPSLPTRPDTTTSTLPTNTAPQITAPTDPRIATHVLSNLTKRISETRAEIFKIASKGAKRTTLEGVRLAELEILLTKDFVLQRKCEEVLKAAKNEDIEIAVAGPSSNSQPRYSSLGQKENAPPSGNPQAFLPLHPSTIAASKTVPIKKDPQPSGRPFLSTAAAKPTPVQPTQPAALPAFTPNLPNYNAAVAGSSGILAFPASLSIPKAPVAIAGPSILRPTVSGFSAPIPPTFPLNRPAIDPSSALSTFNRLINARPNYGDVDMDHESSDDEGMPGMPFVYRPYVADPSE